MPLSRPKPKREIQLARACCPRRSARVTAPTFEDRARIWATVIVSVPRGSASWMIRSATWIEYGRTELGEGGGAGDGWRRGGAVGAGGGAGGGGGPPRGG